MPRPAEKAFRITRLEVYDFDNPLLAHLRCSILAYQITFTVYFLDSSRLEELLDIGNRGRARDT
jgi:hypothetical protein